MASISHQVHTVEEFLEWLAPFQRTLKRQMELDKEKQGKRVRVSDIFVVFMIDNMSCGNLISMLRDGRSGTLSSVFSEILPPWVGQSSTVTGFSLQTPTDLEPAIKLDGIGGFDNVRAAVIRGADGAQEECTLCAA